MSEWIGTGEAARLLGVTRYYLYGLIQRGELPAYRIASNIRLRRDDVERLLRLARGVVALLAQEPT